MHLLKTYTLLIANLVDLQQQTVRNVECKSAAQK